MQQVNEVTFGYRIFSNSIYAIDLSLHRFVEAGMV
jgi:hypothetical protein